MDAGCFPTTRAAIRNQPASFDEMFGARSGFVSYPLASGRARNWEGEWEKMCVLRERGESEWVEAGFVFLVRVVKAGTRFVEGFEVNKGLQS